MSTLRTQMTHDMLVRGLAEQTQKSYTPLGRLRDLRMLSARASYAGLNSSKIASQERPC
jgi:hypothetical protein